MNDDKDIEHLGLNDGSFGKISIMMSEYKMYDVKIFGSTLPAVNYPNKAEEKQALPSQSCLSR